MLYDGRKHDSRVAASLDKAQGASLGSLFCTNFRKYGDRDNRGPYVS
jgi:hypothetical protein